MIVRRISSLTHFGLRLHHLSAYLFASLGRLLQIFGVLVIVRQIEASNNDKNADQNKQNDQRIDFVQLLTSFRLGLL